MASVKILREPIASDPASETPRAQWSDLMEMRRLFCTQYLPKNCRHLLFFVTDGEANDWVGYSSREAYLRDGLGLDPDVVDWAVAGLRKMRPDEDPPLSDAVLLGKHGENRYTESRPDIVRSTNYGNSRDYILGRLDRALEKDGPHPEFAALAAKVRARQMSARAAAIEAGFQKRPTTEPFDRITELLDHLSVKEIRQLRRNLESYLWFREHEHDLDQADLAV